MAVRRSVKWVSLALAGVGLAAIVGLWVERKPIARDMLDDYLARHHVPASYDIKAMETRRQRLENVRLGDPKNPDLTADWVEIDVGPSLSGLSVKAVRAGGVRVKGRLAKGGLSLGAVDRLLPPPSGAFRLPDIDLSLEDARMRLDSPWGQMGGRLDGQGNLRAGFEGQMALVAPRLAMDGCAATGVTAFGDVSIVGSRPSFEGPVRFAQARCGAASGEAGTLTLDASIAEDARDWRGRGDLLLARTAAKGLAARGADLRFRFEGDGKKTAADFELAVNALATPDAMASRVRAQGKAVLGARGVIVDGDLRAGRVVPAGLVSRTRAQLTGLGAGTPVGPIAERLAASVAALSKGIAGHARFSASLVDGENTLALSDIGAASASGASLSLAGRDVVRIDGGGTRVTGTARFGGGGFPDGTARLDGTSGVVTLSPYAARNARLGLTPVRLGFGRAGFSLDTVATMDGPLGSGRVTGLTVPLKLAAGQTLPTGCFPVRFRSLAVETLRLGVTQVRACMTHDEVRLGASDLRGHLGAAPFALSAGGARYGFARGVFSLANANIVLGGEAPSHVGIGQLDGRITGSGASGRYEGLSGRIGTVPLQMADGNGDWSFARGVLLAHGAMQVSDTQPDVRFFPLRADGIALRLAGGRLTATAQVREPKSGAPVAGVSIEHALSSGTGHALLDVAGLSFGPLLQPEAITPTTLGVVANVQGRIAGTGRIDWTPDGVTSSGKFSTDGLDYAAAFGPVTGMKGEIAFSDLLGLVTEPDQQMTVAGINPGIAVLDGKFRYRLLPGYKVQIESGRWPFAGGHLILEPTVLDLSKEADRRLTFRVEGLDAARFIETMEFENIAATGTYDGVLPMVFDANGGRIEGGRLVAQGGGTLSYVGQVSNENLGLMGRFAFDALKSMKYSRLAIDLNGAIDGDVITKISFAGVNQAPVGTARTKLPIKVIGITNMPFIFNVTITAKFRQLFDMARSFNDPSILINRAIPRLEPLPVDERKAVKPVQPAESPPKP